MTQPAARRPTMRRTLGYMLDYPDLSPRAHACLECGLSGQIGFAFVVAAALTTLWSRRMPAAGVVH